MKPGLETAKAIKFGQFFFFFLITVLWVACKSNEKWNIRQMKQIPYTADAEGFSQNYRTVKDRSKYEQMQEEEGEETSYTMALNW